MRRSVFTREAFGLFFLIYLIQFVQIVTAFYENSPVKDLNPKEFNKLVLSGNSVSVVEFYAPWCGHCQNLKPEYIKTAKGLKGLANVVAVNCHEPENHEICSRQQIQGYPTIKVFRPQKADVDKLAKAKQDEKKHRYAASEAYNGPRDAKSMISFALSRLRNYVTSIVSQEKLDKFLASQQKTQRSGAILLQKNPSEKHKGIPPLVKVLSSDFLHDYQFGFVPAKKGAEVWQYFGLDPQTEEESKLVLINKDGSLKTYEGALKKEDIIKFLKNNVSRKVREDL